MHQLRGSMLRLVNRERAG